MADESRESEGKRYPLNMRTTKAIRDQLAQAALSSGRSLVQEVETRLTRSFELDAMLGLLNGPDVDASYLRAHAGAVSEARKASGSRKYSEADTRVAMESAAEVVSAIYFWRPGSSVPDDPGRSDIPFKSMTPRQIGAMVAYEHLVFTDDIGMEAVGITPLPRRWSRGAPEQGPPWHYYGPTVSLAEIMGR